MAIAKCPECGETVSTTVNKCIHCGTEFKVCPNCQTAAGMGDAFCPECGTRLAQMTEAPTQKQTTEAPTPPATGNPNTNYSQSSPETAKKNTLLFEEYMEKWEQSGPSAFISRFLYVVSRVIDISGKVLAIPIFLVLLGFYFLFAEVFGIWEFWGFVRACCNFVFIAMLCAAITTGISNFVFVISETVSYKGIWAWSRKEGIDLLNLMRIGFDMDDDIFKSKTKSQKKKIAKMMYHVTYAQYNHTTSWSMIPVYIMDALDIAVPLVEVFIMIICSMIITDVFMLMGVWFVMIVLSSVESFISNKIRKKCLSKVWELLGRDIPGFKALAIT